MLRTTRPTTRRHNPADWIIFYTTFLLAKNIKIPFLGCDGVEFDRHRCLRGSKCLHVHGQPWYTPPHPMLFQPYYQYCLTLALFLLWYLYVCLHSRNAVAWLYLFLHTVLRYFYNQYMSLVYFLHLFKLHFFIAKCIHCQRTISV